MKIKMLKTSLGADDGINLLTYKEGDVYEVSEDLAQCFLSREEAAEHLEEEEIVLNEEAAEQKAKNRAPKNKAK